MTQPQQAPQPPPEPVVDSDLRPMEDAFYTMVFAALVAWLGKIRPKVMSPFRLWRQSPDPQMIQSEDDFWNSRVDQLVAWLETNPAGDGEHRLAVLHPHLQPRPSGTNAFVSQHLQQVRSYLVRIPEEVFEQVRREISEGQAQGEPFTVIAERVDRVLTATGSEKWPSRARTIAVTEVNGASNAGWYGAAAQLQNDLGHPISKRWLAAHDDRVRETHREADRQKRPLLEPFAVGGWPMMYPGDKNGPPEEVINCRCTAVVEGV